MINRRQLMWSSAAAALAQSTTAQAQWLPGLRPSEGDAARPVAAEGAVGRFEANHVIELARQMAARPFAASTNETPEFFANLSYDQYVGVRARPSGMLWFDEQRRFVIEPLHRGALFRDHVVLYVVADGVMQRVAYKAENFDFGGLQPPPASKDMDFSGFRIFSGSGERKSQMAIFQGATFYRAIAKGQNMGTVGRTLTLRPGELKGEEIPVFRAFWIEQPQLAAESLTVHALLESESVTAAARFTVRPGDMTIIDVEVTVFARVAIDHVGWGGQAATYLFGPASRRNTDDVREAVFEANGLQVKNGRDEWIWRPLTNPQALQVSAFVDRNPRGFGLQQRERSFAAFQDDEQRFDKRPSVWVEPLADWGEGSVQLIEIPTESEVNRNIITYWRPKAPLAVGAESSFAYRQYWCWSIPEPPPLAKVSLTRVGRGRNGRRKRFLVEFVGDELADPRRLAELKTNLTAGPGVIAAVRLWPYPERKALRVAFELDPGSEQLCELRLILEAAGKPLSETWLYRWSA